MPGIACGFPAGKHRADTSLKRPQRPCVYIGWSRSATSSVDGNVPLKHLLNMSGGLACNNFDQTDPLHFTPQDHHSIGYNDGVNAVQASISVPLRFIPGTVNRYLNCDVMAVTKVLRDIVGKKYSVDWLAFPQRALVDKIGARSFVIEPDPFGNFIFQGHVYASTRD